VSASQSI